MPPIEDVPAVTTARATAADVERTSTCALLADTGAAGGTVVVEQLSDGDLLAALGLDGSDVVGVPRRRRRRRRTRLQSPSRTPATALAVAAALAGDPLPRRPLRVFLAARHPFADWLFTPRPGAHVLGQPAHSPSRQAALRRARSPPRRGRSQLRGRGDLCGRRPRAGDYALIRRTMLARAG